MANILKKRIIKRLLVAFLDPSFFSRAKIPDTILLDAMKYAAPKYAHGKLIDLGCGTKPYTKIFEPFISSYFGVDSPDVAKFHYGLDTTADLWADCTETGLDGEMFDTVLSTQVLEHIKNPNKFLSEAYRLLKNNGYLILTTSFCQTLHGEPNDYYRFTVHSLKDLFLSNNFKIIDIIPLGNYGITATYLKFSNIHYKNSFLNFIFDTLYVPVTNILFYLFKRKPDIHNYNASRCPFLYLGIAQK